MHLQLQQFVFHITQPEGLFLSDHLIFLDNMAHFFRFCVSVEGLLNLLMSPVSFLNLFVGQELKNGR